MFDSTYGTVAEENITIDMRSERWDLAGELREIDGFITGATLDMVFPRAASPRELMAEFAAVRGAFAVSRELAGLIG